MHRNRTYRRLIFTSALFSLAGLLLLLALRNVLLYALATHFLLNTGMVLVCFGWTGRREFLENWAVTYLVVILLGGFLEWVTENGVLPRNVLSEALVGALFLYAVLLYVRRRRRFGSHLLRAELCKGERTLSVTAYWDSGNQLRDPYTGQSVSILSRAKAGELFSEELDRFRLVPYRSLGEQNGMLWVTDVEELRLYKGKECVSHAHAAVGIAQQGLLEEKAYDLVLHASLR